MSTERLYRRIMAAFETAYLDPWAGLYHDTPEDREHD